METTPHLFQPLTMRSVTSRNRVVMSPMCQYSATDGMPDDWHFQHLASRAVGGTGIIFTEATAVHPTGRITPQCLGLWNDQQRDAFSRITAFIKSRGAVAGIQLAHAGRKASSRRPWEGGKAIAPRDGGWPVIGPSAIPYGPGSLVPAEMDEQAIAEVVTQFAAATRRARLAGFDLVEVHGAHGYLISTFLSPLSNQRTDRYGGSIENRARFLVEVIDAVRSEWPDDKPLFVRISCSDWIPGGWDIEQSVKLAAMLKAGGKVDLVDCSSAGVDARQQISMYAGWQVHFADAIRRRADIATGAVGCIFNADLAEHILASGQADLIFLARALLNDPYWALHAAKTLKARVEWPDPYRRGDI